MSNRNLLWYGHTASCAFPDPLDNTICTHPNNIQQRCVRTSCPNWSFSHQPPAVVIEHKPTPKRWHCVTTVKNNNSEMRYIDKLNGGKTLTQVIRELTGSGNTIKNIKIKLM